MLKKDASEGLWGPLRPSEALWKHLFSEALWGPQRVSEALWKYIFRTINKTIARARGARALEISRYLNSRVQDVRILWGITLIKIFSFPAGPKPIPEIRIESTSMSVNLSKFSFRFFEKNPRIFFHNARFCFQFINTYNFTPNGTFAQTLSIFLGVPSQNFLCIGWISNIPSLWCKCGK